MAGYSAAKHAVIGLTRSAAREYAALGIRINAVCPYAIDGTNIGETMGDTGDKFTRNCEIVSPMRRVGRLEETVDTFVLLLSPGNTYMTGQAIAIDGGVSA